jgi:NAD(P)H-dependent FMN reductase
MKKKILGINGSASPNSSNLAILKFIEKHGEHEFDMEILEDLSALPHFTTERTDEDVPEAVVEFRNKIDRADGVIISTPEYVFSIPARLKNAIEWCVSTNVFSEKPAALITASASGAKGHEEIKLIIETLQAVVTENTSLLIRGVKGKVDRDGNIKDDETANALKRVTEKFTAIVQEPIVK